jgi:hypothetical protein
MKIRAKIQISSSFKTEDGKSEQINAHGVYGGSTNAEDNTFSAATPALNLQMWVSNPDVVGLLQQGKKYYIDFTEAPE